MTKLIKAGDFSRRYILARQKAADLVYLHKEQTCPKCGAEFAITDDDFKKLSVLYKEEFDDFEAHMAVACPTCDKLCILLSSLWLEADWDAYIAEPRMQRPRSWFKRTFLS
jgi:hypothetical protein